MIPACNCVPGMALDLTTNDPEDGQPWDFSKAQKREKARRRIREQQQYLLVGSPMCTAYSSWQCVNNVDRTHDEIRRMHTEAMMHSSAASCIPTRSLEADTFYMNIQDKRPHGQSRR